VYRYTAPDAGSDELDRSLCPACSDRRLQPTNARRANLAAEKIDVGWSIFKRMYLLITIT
jgi:hypothetical protein